MSEGLLVSLNVSELKQLEYALEAALNEMEVFEERYRATDDADVLDRLWGRFWHGHGSIAAVADSLSSIRGQVEELQNSRAGTA